MNIRGGKQKAQPTRARPKMLQPGKLQQQNVIRRNLSKTTSHGRSTPPPSEPLAPTNIVDPAQTPSPILSSTPEAFVFMPNPSLNLPTTGASSSQHAPHESPVAENVLDEEIEDEDMDEEDEDEVGKGKSPVPPPVVQRKDGKVVIRPYGKGLTPSHHAAAVIRFAIQDQFDEPIHDWSATTEVIRNEWFKKFGKIVTWDDCYNHVVRVRFEKHAKKRLNDMLSKVRRSGKRPGWIREIAYKGLQEYWGGKAFQDISKQNKKNRASTKGGAVHTSGRKSHADLALELRNEYKREVRPDELFLKTHKKKTGAWVEDRAEVTYETFKQNVTEMVGEINVEEVDGALALQCWKKAAGGPTRGNVYGLAGLSVNVRPGTKSLTQDFEIDPFGSMYETSLQEEREARLRAEKIAQEAKEDAREAKEVAREAKESAKMVTDNYRLLASRIEGLERERGSGSAIHSRGHCDYDEDLDEDSLSDDN